MGVRLKIDDKVYEAESYTVQEDSTPLSSQDSSGSVGTMTFSLPKSPGMRPWMLIDKEVSLVDSRRGSTIGFVSSVTDEDVNVIQLECQSRLGRLNVYNIQAQPFDGTLRDAFAYYLALANQDFDLFIDPQIANRPVVFQGWSGELWLTLKQMAAAQSCEVALVSNVILLRPLRTREAVDYRNVTRGRTYGSGQLARAVEVYYYSNKPITEELVYPPGGWSNEVEIITVGAGETIEYPIELSASVTWIQQPQISTFVEPGFNSGSVFTVSGDDGLPINAAQWNDFGGRLSVAINPDTTSLTVHVTAPTGLFNKDATEILTYQLALASGNSSRYSTLRIIGTGVAFDKQLITVRTLVPDNLAGTDVGITIDNPFLSSLSDAYEAGARAAKFYAGHEMLLSGQMTTINQLGDNGSAAYPKYSYDQAQHQGKTYAQVKAGYAGKTYADIQQAYFDVVRDDFDNQVFGNANGVRVWDRVSCKFYRVRSATVGPDSVSFDAEDDVTNDDHQNALYGKTYGQVQAAVAGVTYAERDRMGVIHV